jgi:sulfonate transport system permease protein
MTIPAAAIKAATTNDHFQGAAGSTDSVDLRRLARGAALPALLLACWWAAFHFAWTDSVMLVPIDKVWDTALRMSSNGQLWTALGASLARDLAGLVLGSLAGFALGCALGLSRLLENLVGPSFHTLKQISLFAWIPLISLWFGLGDSAKVVFIALAAFFPVMLNTFEGIRSVPRELIEVGRVCALSPLQMLRHVVLPSALPSIFNGVHLALIYAWLATLGAEYLLTSGIGIGNLLTDGREHLWMDQVLLGIVIVGLVGFALNLAASRIESRLLRWRGSSTGQY